jgi:hypothetical protein
MLSEEEALSHDTRNMILLEALGNAGMERSFDHIVSYINVTTVPLLKRSGLHALRYFHHVEVRSFKGRLFCSLTAISPSLEHKRFTT